MTLTQQTSGCSLLVGGLESKNRPYKPFEENLCRFLNDLSREIMNDPEAAKFPDVATFSFWCRKAHINKLKKDRQDGRCRLGLGTVFHIAPSNVPVNFAFSFAFGLLSGNANIVRVPTKEYPQIDIICHAIDRLFNTDRYAELKSRNAFVRYPQDNHITEEFSSRCNARIIWGGDATIRAIRKIPIPERSVDIPFSDRYSICVIDAPAIGKLTEYDLIDLADNFYNDTFLMDQNACSSPHLIVWRGEGKRKAQQLFWEAISNLVGKKYDLEWVRAVDKYTLMCRNAIDLDNITYVKNHGSNIYRIGLKQLPEDIDAFKGNCGYFYEYETDNLEDLVSIINTKYQTLTYFGIESNELQDFVMDNRLSGIDRIVPVGRALEIELIWDGYDIVETLTRIVNFK